MLCWIKVSLINVSLTENVPNSPNPVPNSSNPENVPNSPNPVPNSSNPENVPNYPNTVPNSSNPVPNYPNSQLSNPVDVHSVDANTILTSIFNTLRDDATGLTPPVLSDRVAHQDYILEDPNIYAFLHSSPISVERCIMSFRGNRCIRV